MISITLAGPPLGKGRVRFVKATGRTFTPERTVTFESRLAFEAQHVMNGRPLLEGPLSVSMRVFMAIPESKPKRWKADALARRVFPTKKPDADNFAKMLDALNMIVWVDDSQIVELGVCKRYSDAPRMEITVEEMQEPEGIFE